MKFKGIIFDLDGTLLDTLAGIAAAMNRVLARAGWPVHAHERYRTFIGDGLDNLVRRAIPAEITDPAVIRQAIVDTSSAYDQTWVEETKHYPGISDLLRTCRDKGLTLAVVTNKPDKPARKMVDAFFPRGTFSHVAGAGGEIPPKPDPTGAKRAADALGIPPAACLFLGDMAVDMATARAAGMFPVGALWGYRSADELQDAGAGVIVRTPTDLKAFFE